MPVVMIISMSLGSDGIRGADGKKYEHRWSSTFPLVQGSFKLTTRYRLGSACREDFLHRRRRHPHAYRHDLLVPLGQAGCWYRAEFEHGLRVVVGDRHREFRRSEVVYVGIPCGRKSFRRIQVSLSRAVPSSVNSLVAPRSPCLLTVIENVSGSQLPSSISVAIHATAVTRTSARFEYWRLQCSPPPSQDVPLGRSVVVIRTVVDSDLVLPRTAEG